MSEVGFIGSGDTEGKLLPIERIAEGLWQTVNGIGGEGLAARRAWLALPEQTKQEWRGEAVLAIDHWKKSKGLI